MVIEGNSPTSSDFGLLETPCDVTVNPYQHSIRSGYIGGISECSRSSPESRKTPGTTSELSSSVPGSSNSKSCVRSGFGFKTPAFGSSSAKSRTPGSRKTPYGMSSAATPGGDHNSSVIVGSTLIILAIVEGRGLARGEVGMSSIDLKNPELKLSQFSDTQSYVKTVTKLQMLSPLEIIMPNTSCEGGNITKLFQLICDQFQATNLSTVQRKYFNETRGLQYLKQLCVQEYNTVEMEVSSKYYCLAAAAALIKYVEFIQNIVYAPSSLKIVFKGSENTTMIGQITNKNLKDAATAKNLELVLNSKDPKSDHSLYGILNFTKTAGGARLLRANILQPSSGLETIKMRQDVVSELTEKEEIFYSLQSVIGRFLDIDHLLSIFVQIPKQESIKTAENKITNVIYLKHTLELIEPLREALRDFLKLHQNEHQMLVPDLSLDDPRYNLMMTKISSVIHDDTRYQKGTLNMRTQKCFAVRVVLVFRHREDIICICNTISDINGLLDVARRTYTEIVDDISQLVSQMAEDFNLPLRTSYSSSRGFYIQLYSSNKDQYNAENLPGIFIKVTKYKNTLNFTTADMIKYNGSYF
ncbi:hypothetical protein KUTeg_001565 [Tegillarca granosa]|uniref:Uncharacterized protein n=1 Tax=Tegillarca granosa TaxID=220873 RepID=A0ABQ9FW97_TEGGR|nr:hypothetical protein KUTeg_001565 [Tegillarca granosa]